MCGSGTLVRFRGRRFILTATHVWQRLRENDLIYFTMAREINHSSNVSRDSLKSYSLDDIPYKDLTPTSPDLTLLELDPVDANLIETRLSFTPLEKAFNAREDELHQDILVVGAREFCVNQKEDNLNSNFAPFSPTVRFGKSRKEISTSSPSHRLRTPIARSRNGEE